MSMTSSCRATGYIQYLCMTAGDTMMAFREPGHNNEGYPLDARGRRGIECSGCQYVVVPIVRRRHERKDNGARGVPP